MRATLLAAVLLLAAPLSGRAADTACSGLATQADMNECAGRAFRQTDATLNQVYGQVTARLANDADTRRALVAAQKAWLGFRDAECAFRTGPAAGGSIHAMVKAMCRTELTAARITTLRSYLVCQEGDLSCPLPPP